MKPLFLWRGYGTGAVLAGHAFGTPSAGSLMVVPPDSQWLKPCGFWSDIRRAFSLKDPTWANETIPAGRQWAIGIPTTQTTTMPKNYPKASQCPIFWRGSCWDP